MSNKRTNSQTKCDLTADLLIDWQVGWRDGEFTSQERVCFEGKLREVYARQVLDNAAMSAVVQLLRIPDSTPNKPMKAQFRDVLGVLEGHEAWRVEWLHGKGLELVGQVEAA